MIDYRDLDCTKNKLKYILSNEEASISASWKIAENPEQSPSSNSPNKK